MDLGINIDWAKDWTGTVVFNDYMKQAGRFSKAGTPWIDYPDLLVDSNKMPLEDFGIVVFRRGVLKEDFKMTLYYKCANSVPYVTAQHGNIVITSKVKDSITGITKMSFYVKAGSSQLFLNFTNTKGGISYLALYEEGTENNGTFNLDFLKLVAYYKCFRYMEILRTNDSTISKWEDRTLPEEACQDYKGIAWEYVAELSNITKTDLWINIPHLADDEYIRNLAELLKRDLKYNQNIYIEYSNEMWNGMFTQSGWNVQQALLEVEAGNSNLNYDCKTNPKASDKYGWGFRRNARRCREISKIFESVWSKEQINKRIRVVIGGFGAVYYVSSTQLHYLSDNYPEEIVGSYIYGIANGCYYGESNQIIKTSTSINDMISAIDDDIINFESRYNYNAFKTLADKYGIKSLIYEGGIDVTQAGYLNNEPNAEIKEAKRLEFHNDVRLKNLANGILNNFKGELFMWYKASVNDIWGFTTNINRTDTPIQSALRNYLNKLLPTLSSSKSSFTFNKKFICKKSGVMGKGFNGTSKLKNIKRGKR